MESSRIFIKGLPPTFTDAEFRKHFSQNREITDAKVFPSRRIGYVGYKTPEDARKAVKYFNKSFIRMSKIGVELARPIQDEKVAKQARLAPTARQNEGELVGLPARDGLKRKRDAAAEDAEDPKLKEFLEVMKPKSKKKAWENGGEEAAAARPVSDAMDTTIAIVPTAESDDEYENVPKKTKHKTDEPATSNLPSKQPFSSDDTPINEGHPIKDDGVNTGVDEANEAMPSAISNSDWARSRTSRLLGLLDEDEEDTTRDTRDGTPDSIESKRSAEKGAQHRVSPLGPVDSLAPVVTAHPGDQIEKDGSPGTGSPETQAVRSSMRLFIRNLPYDVQASDLESEFLQYGNIEEVHVPVDTKTGSAKGFAYIQFSDPDSAARAFSEKDEQIFQGRLLHVLPASAKRESKLDDFELSKLPLKKQQQIKRRREAGTATFNWNALYMNADAVVSSVAARLGLSKSEVLDPTSSDAAIKQAHAETHIIQETKSYFKEHGVDLDSFKKSQRGDVAILVKNIPYDCSKDELRRLFEEHGDVKQFLMPPSGTIAIVEFLHAAQCRAAFGALAYRKIKSSVLFLEKAPKDLFTATPSAPATTTSSEGVSKTAASDLKDTVVSDTAGSATLFVRNLNFSTTSEKLTTVFEPLEGFLSARVKTKTDPKKPGQILSMGFGFLEFRSAQQAQSALRTMDGYTLEGHKLQVRASHKGADAAEERRKADAEKRKNSQRTKVIIKNLPFEADKKDVRALFGAYGKLRSVRVPKKMDRSARGFAFADFVTPKEAENAMDALRDTHLLGRRLVLELAAEDAEDAEAEIERMQQKVGQQVNKVALQKLTSGGRKKFSTQNDDDDV